MMQAISTGAIEEMRRRRARENASALMGTLQSALPMETPLEMEITLRLLGEKEPVRVSLRVGQERMYVVKSMAQFLRGLQEKTAIAFGKGFVLEPEWMGFTGVDAKIIKLLQDAAYVCQLEGKLVQTGLDAKYLTVADRFVPRLMQLLMAKPFKISFGEEVVSVPSVFDGQVELLFGVFASGANWKCARRCPKPCACSTRTAPMSTARATCSSAEAQRGLSRVLLAAQAGPGFAAAFRFDAQQSTRVISDLLPALERAGTVTLDGALAERIIRRELKVRAYFDRDNNLVLCRMAFLYGDEEIDPFAAQAAPTGDDERIMLLRDAAAERRALDLLATFGFRMQKGRVVLGGQEPIYRFLTEGIYKMQENAEVYCSDEFRKMTPRKPHFVGTLRMQDGALRLEMTEDGEPAPEVVDILRALRDRKKYFRLKDGSFLDLSEMDEWREMAEAAVGGEMGEPEEEEKNLRGVVEVASYRAAYMTSLLESGKIPVKAEDSVKNMVGSLQDDGEPCLSRWIRCCARIRCAASCGCRRSTGCTWAGHSGRRHGSGQDLAGHHPAAVGEAPRRPERGIHRRGADVAGLQLDGGNREICARTALCGGRGHAGPARADHFPSDGRKPRRGCVSDELSAHPPRHWPALQSVVPICDSRRGAVYQERDERRRGRGQAAQGADASGADPVRRWKTIRVSCGRFSTSCCRAISIPSRSSCIVSARARKPTCCATASVRSCCAA